MFVDVFRVTFIFYGSIRRSYFEECSLCRIYCAGTTLYYVLTAQSAGALLPSPLPASDEDHQFSPMFIPPPHQFADTETHWSPWSKTGDHDACLTTQFNTGKCA